MKPLPHPLLPSGAEFCATPVRLRAGLGVRLQLLCEERRLFFSAALQERIESYRHAVHAAARSGRDRPVGGFRDIHKKGHLLSDPRKSLAKIR